MRAARSQSKRSHHQRRCEAGFNRWCDNVFIIEFPSPLTQFSTAKMSEPGKESTDPAPGRLSNPLFTIGYGNRSLEQMIAVLQANHVTQLIDVRTAPYSRFKPEFSRDALQAALQRHGIDYLFMGDTLGGQPDCQDCYTQGKADYDKIRSQSFYQNGIEHLRSLLPSTRRFALMCGEGRPEQCHRSKLIGETLNALGIPICHIDEDNQPRSHTEIIDRLTGGQLNLFDTPSFTSRKRYPSKPGKGQP
jgi:hypothetical protein